MLVEQPCRDLGVGGAADVRQEAAVERLGGCGDVDAEAVGQAHGDDGAVEAVLEREADAQVGRQGQRGNRLSGPDFARARQDPFGHALRLVPSAYDSVRGEGGACSSSNPHQKVFTCSGSTSTLDKADHLMTKVREEM